MKQERKERLTKAGVNLPKGRKRFMDNEGLYEDFLNKFPQDRNMYLLEEALQAEKAEEAFHAAHTLLGLAANLSLEALAQALRPVTEALRGGDIAAAKSSMPKVKEIYIAMIAAFN